MSGERQSPTYDFVISRSQHNDSYALYRLGTTAKELLSPMRKKPGRTTRTTASPGPRVPTVMVAPWIEEQTVIRAGSDTPFNATYAATLLNWFGIPRPLWWLGDRMAAAPRQVLPEEEQGRLSRRTPWHGEQDSGTVRPPGPLGEAGLGATPPRGMNKKCFAISATGPT